jgi:hypothetical protein
LARSAPVPPAAEAKTVRLIELVKT